MPEMILFFVVPAIALFVVPIGEVFGVHPFMLLLLQLAAAAGAYKWAVHRMQDVTERCRLAYIRAGDILEGVNTSNVPKGRKCQTEYALLGAKAARYARWYPPIFIASSIIFAAIVFICWRHGVFEDDVAVRGSIFSLAMLCLAHLLRSASRAVFLKLHEIGVDW